jgi:hypothetical protein
MYLAKQEHKGMLAPDLSTIEGLAALARSVATGDNLSQSDKLSPRAPHS